MEIPTYKRDDSSDYLLVLRAIREIPFEAGRNLLVDFLTGNIKNKSIIRNNLNSVRGFDSFDDKDNVNKIIDNLIGNNLIEIIKSDKNKFWKILRLTSKGQKEIWRPSLYEKKLSSNFVFMKSEVTDDEKVIFKELDSFLNGYNDYQKKAVVSNKEKILCIAGAGSGKTTALVKRIEFLVKYKGIDSSKILAITFTRKAREEMIKRLFELKISANIETFNSFSEKILRKYFMKIYGRPMNVINYGQKVMSIMTALESKGLKIDDAIEKYFSIAQRRGKTKEELSNIFMNDCFFILDYFKSKNKELYDFSIDADPDDRESARMIYDICKHLKEYMDKFGLRDFTDQVLDCIKFFRSNNDSIPRFEHILVDEYQDVNSMQIELLDLLDAKNLFCVGDPRQSIFGWRGSDIKYILKFHEKFSSADIIHLVKNYRSRKPIVDFINASIRDMNLPDLEHNIEGEKEIEIFDFSSENEEIDFVVDKILNSDTERGEIFVLARTNRQLADLSLKLKEKKIGHKLKTDDSVNNAYFQHERDEVVLATIHSIKGLEAKMVIVIGCNELNFPCKASDHPVIEMVKVEEYDREEEEKRLFYVALSRAKDRLILSYTGKKPSYFLNQEMLDMVNNN